ISSDHHLFANCLTSPVLHIPERAPLKRFRTIVSHKRAGGKPPLPPNRPAPSNWYFSDFCANVYNSRSRSAKGSQGTAFTGLRRVQKRRSHLLRRLNDGQTHPSFSRRQRIDCGHYS